jgi:hypothetical protein
MVSYADNAVIGCERKEDADRIMKGKSLTVYEIRFNDTSGKAPPHRLHRTGRRSRKRTLYLSGFTLYWTKSKKGGKWIGGKTDKNGQYKR